MNNCSSNTHRISVGMTLLTESPEWSVNRLQEVLLTQFPQSTPDLLRWRSELVEVGQTFSRPTPVNRSQTAADAPLPPALPRPTALWMHRIAGTRLVHPFFSLECLSFRRRLRHALLVQITLPTERIHICDAEALWAFLTIGQVLSMHIEPEEGTQLELSFTCVYEEDVQIARSLREFLLDTPDTREQAPQGERQVYCLSLLDDSQIHGLLALSKQGRIVDVSIGIRPLSLLSDRQRSIH